MSITTAIRREAVQEVPRELGAPILDVKDVSITYETAKSLVIATKKVSFQVYPGERIILLGASGCGKSSLLKAVGGYIKPVGGKITLNGNTVTRPGPDRMMVFQEFDQLMPWKTVTKNIMFPLQNGDRLNRAEAERRALDLIEKVGLSKFKDAYPHMLSGGMKQRVAIARALAMQPAILLMDEPFAALDALTRQKMQTELLDLWESIRCAMIFVTHSIDEAILLGTRIVVLSPHPGRVRSELNCGKFGFHNMDSKEFSDLRERLSQMLFQDHHGNK